MIKHLYILLHASYKMEEMLMESDLWKKKHPTRVYDFKFHTSELEMMNLRVQVVEVYSSG